MSRRAKYTAEEKHEILRAYENGTGTILEIASMYKISKDTFYTWKYNYSKYGIDGLRKSRTWKRYSKELKELAVKDYISGQFSQREVMKKYGLSTKSVLEGWLKKYNGHRDKKVFTKGMSQSMTKGKVTTWKERLEITLCCIADNNDYQHAAEGYNVSYQQVYQWVKKYESGGENALKDRRGRKKFEEELTLEDKVKISMKKLEVENERLRAENEFLKKLEKIERGRY